MPSRKTMQLDIFIPSLSLAFEYQGIQHYKDVHTFGITASEYAIRDEQKRQQCKDLGITLIEVSYQWDGRKDTLLPLLLKLCPQIVT
jgi:hypothetical protein